MTTSWHRLTPGDDDRTGLAIAQWIVGNWIVIRSGYQKNGELHIAMRGGAMAISATELANIPPAPEHQKDTP